MLPVFVGFLLGLLIKPDDGGNMSLWNISEPLPVVLHPRRYDLRVSTVGTSNSNRNNNWENEWLINLISLFSNVSSVKDTAKV
jgi:hypothetical protein